MMLSIRKRLLQTRFILNTQRVINIYRIELYICDVTDLEWLRCLCDWCIVCYCKKSSKVRKLISTSKRCDNLFALLCGISFTQSLRSSSAVGMVTINLSIILAISIDGTPVKAGMYGYMPRVSGLVVSYASNR